MRALRAAATILPILGLCAAIGCAGSAAPASITISPGGSITVTGPTRLSANVLYSKADVTWSLSGPGSISGNTGNQIIYRPPEPVGSVLTAVVTAQVEATSTSVTLNLAPAVMSPTKIPGLTAAASVSYDAYDIPHISCASAIDCFAVQGYVHAHDRLFPMDFLRRVARGHLAELIGVRGLSQDVQLRTLFTTRDGKRIEDTLAAAVDSDSKAKLDAYVAGINTYLNELKANPNAKLPGEYAQLPYKITAADIPAWTEQDTFALARLQQFQLSESLDSEQAYGVFASVYGAGPLADLGKIHSYIRAAPLPTGATHTYPTRGEGAIDDQRALQPLGNLPDMSAWAGALKDSYAQLADLRASLKPLGETVGSNNWVVDAAHSASGHAMVANDPHLSLQYPPLFHLATLTSSTAADNLDLAGGAFPGIPGALVGRGKNVGWGVTVVGYDVTDLYLEQFLDHAHGCPAPDPVPCVLYKSAPVVVGIYPQSFKVRVAAGSGASSFVEGSTLSASVPAYVAVVPHHGPVVKAPDANGKGVSLRWTGQESATDDLKAFLGLATAHNNAEAITALKYYATGAQNFVLADDDGNIAYDPHALVPVRNFADARVTAPDHLIPPWFPLPGDGSAEWGTGNAADNCAGAGTSQPAAACWIADSALPFASSSSKGFLATANADPIGTGDDNSPLSHPPYFSFQWDDSTGLRHARITALLTNMTKNGAKVSLDNMQQVQSDHVSTLGATFDSVLSQIPTSVTPPEFQAAQALFAQWKTDGYNCPTGLIGTDPATAVNDPDAINTRDSAACFLFHAFLRTLLQNVFNDDLAVAGLSMDTVAAIKGMFYMLTTAPSGDQTFCNNVNALGQVTSTHSCIEQAVIAMSTAYDLLTAQHGATSNWRWGRVHTMTPVSQLALVTDGYEPGPFARPGGAFTVDVGAPSPRTAGITSFAFTSSGNVRHISVMDPTTPIIKMQLPGPERDQPEGILDGGPDLLGGWVANQYFDFAYRGQIAPATVATQSFSAQ
ncbi:MAG: penicillin acylase family protein [Deltaproteobacteria bacterium]|nr:penicillin acylase family protein [Deltaproteobacteria bacterium]